MRSGWVRLATGVGLATAACRVVVDQPASPPPPYPYPYPATTYATSYPTSYPAKAYPTANNPPPSYPPRTYPAPAYPAASYATTTRPPPPQPSPPQPSPPQPAAPRASRVSTLDETARQTPRPPSPAPACLDAAAAELPDCETVRRAPARCSLDTTPRQRCSGYRTYFDPKVAASAISCLSSLSSRDLCDPTRASDCAKIALAEACVDPSVDQLCQIAEAPCKTTSSACAATLSGLNDQGQQLVAECVAHGCSGGIDGCVDALSSGRRAKGNAPRTAPSSASDE
jgi:hypothetical protein